MLNKIALIYLFFMGMLFFPNTTSSGQIRDIETQLQRAHQTLAIRFIELQQLDPHSSVQAYLKLFYVLNRGPYQAKTDIYFSE